MQPTGVLENAKATNPLKALLEIRPVDVAGLHPARSDHQRKLKTMIEEDGLRGMTSNPSIFEKAIGDSSLYDDMLKSLASQPDLDATGAL